MIDLLCNLSKKLFEKNEDISDYFKKIDLPVATTFEIIQNPPLFFVHIPKTSGASISNLLENNFDIDKIFPGWNMSDFNKKVKVYNFNLFRGHFPFGQSNNAPKETQLFSIMREPKDLLYSYYRFTKKIKLNYIKIAKNAANLYGVKLKSKEIQKKNMREKKIIFSKYNFSEMIKNDKIVNNRNFYNIQTKMFSNIGSNLLKEKKKMTFMNKCRLRKNIYPIFNDARKNVRKFLLIGTFDNQEESIEILFYQRNWPTPESIPRIHEDMQQKQYKTGKAIGLRNMHKVTALDNYLFKYVQKDLRNKSKKILNDSIKEDKREKLNLNHKNFFFKNTSKYYVVDLSATKAWPGTNWSLREQNSNNQYWRWIGKNGNASIFLPLIPESNYLLSLYIHTAINSEVLSSLEAKIQDKLLFFAGKGEKEGYTTLYWLIEKSSVINVGGNVEIIFQIKDISDINKKIAIARILVQPWE